KYLDFFGGILTTSLGYDIPEITEALNKQVPKTLHSSTLYLSEPMIELAELIADLSGIPDAKVFFTTSGTEANDAALLLATTHRRSNQVLALRNSYHGRSFTTIAITSHRSWSPTSVSGLSVNYVHGGYRLRSPFREFEDDAYTEACVDDLHQVFDMMTSGDVAAMIAEPIQGVGGFATPPDGFFGAMKKELDNRGVLFISDEVQTGWGRTGDHFWGYQAHGITPDILTFAKGVGNGLALGGVVASAELMDSLPGNSISTFGGNPISSAGALATIKYMIDHDTQGNSKRMGDRLVAHLQPAVDASDTVAELRGRGLMQALETVQPGTLEPNVEAAGQIMEQARAE
ncbi:MAG: aspartate aminotransferase family protein, partial [Acidimicrobiales bacterium]|nr:aspartate aminotransferase family protein [Acidimicrobiales bacterium]